MCRLILVAFATASIVLTTTNVHAESAQERMLAAFHEGLQLKDKHEYDGAAQEFGKAVTLSRSILGRGQRGDTHLQTAMLMEHQANSLFAAFRRLEARTIYLESLQVALREPGEEAARLARSIEGNLGNVAKRMGDWSQAEQYFNQSINRDANPQSRAVNQLNLAWLYLAVGRLDDAHRLFSESARIWRPRNDDSSQLDLAACTHGLGMVTLQRRQHAAALELFRKAYALRQSRLESSHRLMGHSLEMIGVALTLNGDMQTGLSCLGRAESNLASFWGPAHEEVAEVRHELALAQARAGETATSLRTMSSSRKGYREYMAEVLIGLEQQAQLKFLAAEKHRLMDAIALAGRHKSSEAARVSGWEWLLNSKGFSFEVLSQRRLLERSSRSNNVEAEAVRRLTEVRRQLAANAAETLKRKMGSKQLDDDEQTIARMLGVGGEMGIAKWAAAGDIQRRLSPGVVLLDFAFIDRSQPSNSAFSAQPTADAGSRYVVWVVTRDKVSVVDLGPARAIESAITEVRNVLDVADKQIERSARRAQAEIDAKLQALSKLVLLPIEDEIRNAKQLSVCPDSALWLLPWPALILSDGKYLVEKSETSFVVSARQLLGRQAQRPRDYAMIMADPDFGMSPQAVNSELEKAKIRDDMFPKRSMQVESGNKVVPRNVRPLPASRLEATTAQPLIERAIDGKAYVYVGGQALESFAKVVRRPKIAVFATHGFLLDDDQSKHPLARSGLLLAGVNARSEGDGDDGILTALEVIDCDFRGTRLVALSACDTALGSSQLGEGIAGLQQAFHLAGAEQVLAKLWKVDDRETNLLMSRFWKHIAAGSVPRQAMRQAQLEQMKNLKTRLGYAHPWLWAAPILTTYESTGSWSVAMSQRQ